VNEKWFLIPALDYIASHKLTAFIVISAGFESLISKSTPIFYAYGEQVALHTHMITNVSF
jgi:hypothetical protein